MDSLDHATADYEGRYAESSCVINGLRLHYTVWGESSKEHVLLVHGLNSMLQSWNPIAARLYDQFHVICVDLRGHGDSDWAREGYAVQHFVSDLAGLMENLGLNRFNLVGHSLGARIGIAFAGTHPDVVQRLVLSDAGPEVSREAAVAVRAKVAPRDVRGFRDEAEALAYFEELYPDWQPVFHRLYVRHYLRTNWASKLVFKADPDLFWLNGSVGLREVPFLWESARRIVCPTLIMRGRRSYLLSPELAGRMLAAIPSARLAEFDTGHYIPREAPEEFVRVLRAFLRET